MLPSLSSSHRTEVYNPKTFFPHAALLGQGFPHCPIFPTAASSRSLDRVSVPVWPISLSARLPIADLVSRYLTNYLMGRESLPQRIAPLTPLPCGTVVLCGISTRFQVLSPSVGQVPHALLTRSPLTTKPKFSGPFDLHVLGTPPAFVLSQDQTLVFISWSVSLLTSFLFRYLFSAPPRLELSGSSFLLHTIWFSRCDLRSLRARVSL